MGCSDNGLTIMPRSVCEGVLAVKQLPVKAGSLHSTTAHKEVGKDCFSSSCQFKVEHQPTAVWLGSHRSPWFSGLSLQTELYHKYPESLTRRWQTMELESHMCPYHIINLSLYMPMCVYIYTWTAIHWLHIQTYTYIYPPLPHQSYFSGEYWQIQPNICEKHGITKFNVQSWNINVDNQILFNVT